MHHEAKRATLSGAAASGNEWSVSFCRCSELRVLSGAFSPGSLSSHGWQIMRKPSWRIVEGDVSNGADTTIYGGETRMPRPFQTDANLWKFCQKIVDVRYTFTYHRPNRRYGSAAGVFHDCSEQIVCHGFAGGTCRYLAASCSSRFAIVRAGARRRISVCCGWLGGGRRSKTRARGLRPKWHRERTVLGFRRRLVGLPAAG